MLVQMKKVQRGLSQSMDGFGAQATQGPNFIKHISCKLATSRSGSLLRQSGACCIGIKIKMNDKLRFVTTTI